MAKLPIEVKNEMAKRHHRLAHYLWHSLRGIWERLDQNARNYIVSIYPGWEVPRPSNDRLGRPIRTNNSGEDFLFMHRQMIGLANSILQSVGNPEYPKVVGWKTLPLPNNAEFPIIPMKGMEEFKSEDFFNNRMRPWEIQYTSENYLSNVTLGEMGVDLEITIHNMMHMRWATPMPNDVGYRPDTAIDQPVNIKWNNIKYDYLGDTYSSHVHDTFWKIHGWVDDRINDWKRVNNIDEINWNGKWIGPMQHHSHQEMAILSQPKILIDLEGITESELTNDFDKMIEVSKVLSKFDNIGFISKEIPQEKKIDGVE
ncbi:hypothetical protein [Cyclobacterium qasimii]|nr:hypothetical protein [Cyclobacterium qasimii]